MHGMVPDCLQKVMPGPDAWLIQPPHAGRVCDPDGRLATYPQQALSVMTRDTTGMGSQCVLSKLRRPLLT